MFANKSCNGLQIFIDDWKTFEPMKTGIAVAWALRKIHPTDWKTEKYNTLLLNKATLDAVTSGSHYSEIEKLWRRDLAAYELRRKKCSFTQSLSDNSRTLFASTTNRF